MHCLQVCQFPTLGCHVCLNLIFKRLKPEQNGCWLADNICKCIFFNANVLCLDSQYIETPLQWYHMSIIASQITSNLTVCSIVCSDWPQRQTSKFHITGPFVRGIHWSPVDSPHKGLVIWKPFPTLIFYLIHVVTSSWQYPHHPWCEMAALATHCPLAVRQSLEAPAANYHNPLADKLANQCDGYVLPSHLW